eukprot:TRINITY_DN5628_c0_g1_i1.p1 TRINITY_DN5628_c0_g1~~TRINITY_DN5628_c0_g1_i1.p1  ORF type:complete len:146 (-),score=30.06 TRINITY_DN5628_c0_g1_i1:184-591(-)
MVAATRKGVCALTTTGTITCFGTGLTAPTAASTIKYIYAGANYHVCAHAVTGLVTCTGNFISSTASPPPSTPMVHVAISTHFACGIKYNGNVVCWGEIITVNPPSGASFVSLFAGPNSMCGIQSDQSITCLGFEY